MTWKDWQTEIVEAAVQAETESGRPVYSFDGRKQEGNAELHELAVRVQAKSDGACWRKVAFYRKDAAGRQAAKEYNDGTNLTANVVHGPVNNLARSEARKDWKRKTAQLNAAAGVEVPSEETLCRRVAEVVALPDFQELLKMEGIVIKAFACSHDGE